MTQSTKSMCSEFVELAEDLQTAVTRKGPFVLHVNGVPTIVSREQFLEFWLECTIENIYRLLEMD